ncbi:MAG: NfeD family protein [Rickettsiales endosymbiont of Dermacentor nuttalli]
MENLGDFILNNIHYVWMVVGVALVLLEVLTVPGIGILCAGLAAVIVGIMILFGLIFYDYYILQMGWFFAWTLLWAMMLWRPLLKLRYSERAYHNIIGEHAIVYKNDLIKGKTGEVKWSGTVMKALIVNDSNESSIGVNQEVIIKNLKGNILLVDVNTL